MPDARTPADRIAAVQRHGDPITPEQRSAAEALLTDMRATAARRRIAAVQRGGDPITGAERAAAEALLADMLAAAARHGVTLADLDWTVDLPGACVDVILARR